MDVYKIAVEIALAGNIAQALTGIAGQMTGLHGKIGAINEAFGGWKATLAVVAGVAGIGLMVKGVDEVFESVKKLSHELSQVQKMGTTPAEYAAMRASAIDVTRQVQGVTETDAVRLYGMTQGMLRPEEARKAMVPLAKLTQSIGSTTGDYEAANQSVYNMVRSADLIGRLSDPITKTLDPDRLIKFLDIAQRVSTATHGAIGPQQWLAMAQQGGPALRAMTDEGMYGSALVAQAMGAQRFGTASMSLMQQFAGGTMFTRNAEALQEHGLLNKGEWKKEAGRVVLTPEAEKRLMDMIKNDPLEFVQKLMKDYAAKGVTAPDDQIMAIFRDFGRQTTQREVSDIMMNIHQMENERDQIKKSLDVGGALIIQNAKDIETSLHNVGAAFENLKTAIGGSDGKITFVVSAINEISTSLRGLTELVRSNPATMKLIGEAMIGLAAGLVVIGGVAAVAGAGLLIPGGLVSLAMIGVGTAIAALAAMKWRTIADGLSWLADGIGKIMAAISAFLTPSAGGHARGLSTPNLTLPNDAPNDSGPSHNRFLHNQSFIAPPKSDRPMVFKTALNIDSRQLAEATSTAFAEMYENSPNSPSANDVAFASINGHNPEI